MLDSYSCEIGDSFPIIHPLLLLYILLDNYPCEIGDSFPIIRAILDFIFCWKIIRVKLVILSLESNLRQGQDYYHRQQILLRHRSLNISK